MNRALGLLVARGWMNVCAFGSFIAVGRFLDPAAFGFYAACSSFVFLFMMVVGAGFAEHVISRDHERRDEAAAFWCSAMTGLVGALVTVIAGLVADHVFGHPDVAKLMYLLAALPLLWGVSVIHEATLIRDGRGGALASVLFVAETIALIVLLIALQHGAGLYALGISRLVNNVVTAIGYFALARTRWNAPVDFTDIHRMARFSVGVLGARLVNWIDGYGADIILVALLAPTGLGHYRMGARLGGAACSIVFQAPTPAQQAYLGARAAHAPERLGRAMLRATRLHLAIATPIFAVLTVCAYDLVVLLLGPGWERVGHILTVLCAPASLGALTGLTAAALIARGMSRQYFLLQTASTIVGAIALICAASGGPVWAAIGKTSVGFVVSLIGVFWIADLTMRDRGHIYKAAGAITFAGVLSALAAFLVISSVPRPDDIMPALARLALVGASGLGAYAVALRLASPATWRQLDFMVRRTLRSRAPRAAIAAPQIAERELA